MREILSARNTGVQTNFIKFLVKFSRRKQLNTFQLSRFAHSPKAKLQKFHKQISLKEQRLERISNYCHGIAQRIINKKVSLFSAQDCAVNLKCKIRKQKAQSS